MSARSSQELAEHLFRREYAKLVAVLTARFGPPHLESIEEAVQEAFLEAMRVWEYRGVPDNAAAWLHTVARNKALNRLRQDRRLASTTGDVPEYSREAELKSDLITPGDFVAAGAPDSPGRYEAGELGEIDEEIQDSLLRMMFVCCHPGLSADSRVALILKTLCGFSIDEIAAAFLSAPAAIQKRLVRARKTLRDLEIGMELPITQELPERLSEVLTALYLLFNEGYKSSQSSQSVGSAMMNSDERPPSRLIRRELCEEALRLLEILKRSELFRHDPQLYACTALMLLNAARFDARLDAKGDIVRMADQDRSLWDRELIARGIAELELASIGGEVSAYHIQAAISAHHCAAPDYASTDWPAILGLYDAWLQLEDTPVIRLNRAIAVGRVHGARPAIRELKALAAEPAFRDYHLYETTLAELYFEAGRRDLALAHFESALELASTPAERRLLSRRIGECGGGEVANA